MEIEAKMKLDGLADVRRRLTDAGGQRKGKVLETNLFFDTPTQSMQRADRGLRLRIAVDEAGRRRCTITMKGPLQPGQLKMRDETEFSVDDSDAARKVLENLGLQLGLSFEKRRESFEFHDCKVELDELPLLGTYVEIEGDSESSVMAAREALGLSPLPLINTGYVTMLSQYLREHKIADPHVKF